MPCVLFLALLVSIPVYYDADGLTLYQSGLQDHRQVARHPGDRNV